MRNLRVADHPVFQGRNVETNYSVSRADAYKASGDFTVKEAAEGLVMLKNDDDGVLPLEDVSKVNLFGMLTAKQIFMGTGSAGGFNRDDDSFLYLDAAFKEANIEVNPDLWNFYKEQEGNASGTAGSVTDMQGSTHSIIELPLDADGYGEVLEGAKDYSDTAIVVVGRAGGEGSDAVMEMNPYQASGRGGMTQYNVGGDERFAGQGRRGVFQALRRQRPGDQPQLRPHPGERAGDARDTSPRL